MAKLKRMSKRQKALKDVLAVQGNMTYKQIKQQVVARGMPFEEVVTGDFPSLSSWLQRNQHKELNPELLDQFDDWVESKLKDQNLIHPTLRLGFIGEKDEEGEVVKRKRIKGIKKPKAKKKEKTEDGIYKGTKKAYTFELAKEGKDKNEVIGLVKERFPEAKDKSISIWFKKALREAKEGK